MSAAPMIRLESTGEPELDALLGGGLPAQSVTVVAGEPGSGKTIFTLQMLFHAARQGRKCLYFTTLSEPAVKVVRYMQGFSFFDPELLDEQIVFADLGTAIRAGDEATLAAICDRVEALEPSFVAIDSFRSIGELLREPGMQRRFVYDLASQVAGWGATTLLVGEYLPDEYSKFAEFAVADGILRLGSRRDQLRSVRELEVLKLRGGQYVSGIHFFDITPDGISVYPRVRAPADLGQAPPAERVGTGIEGLDALLGGGLPRASITVVQGGTGTGKTLIGLSFLIEGARRGERGILFTHEETPDQLRAIAQSLGLDLAPLEARGLLHLVYTSPVELSTDRFLNEMRRLIERVDAKRVALDSLSALSLGVGSDRRFKELVYAISKHLRASGVSLMMTMESEQLLGTANLSGLGISFIADNLLQLRYVELDGRLERAISVIKARGIAHDTEMRAVVIGQGGMTVVAERFRDLRGVLTGLPSRK